MIGQVIGRVLLLLGIGTGVLACTAAVGSAEGPAPAARAAPAAPEYRIGPGDQLEVFVFNQPELSVKVPVRPDGLISSPLVENMQAAGRTPSELAREMEKTLSQYVRSPTVNVIVTTFVGTYDAQIRVVGQAANPQSLPYSTSARGARGMSHCVLLVEDDSGLRATLCEALRVEGYEVFAAGNRAKIVRNIDGKSTEIKVKLSRLLDGDVKSNLEMRPGDVLIIPESRF